MKIRWLLKGFLSRPTRWAIRLRKQTGSMPDQARNSIPGPVKLAGKKKIDSYYAQSHIPSSGALLFFYKHSLRSQMQNIIGYLKSACQYSTSGNVGNNPSELVAIKKLAAMSSVKDYLCQNSQVYLKGWIFLYLEYITEWIGKWNILLNLNFI